MESRIDFHPIRQRQDYKLRSRRAIPFGATLVPSRVIFAICSRHATACTLVLFEKGAPEPRASWTPPVLSSIPCG